MAGRGDNNKQGSSGRGASNQSKQGLKEPASQKGTGAKKTGGTPSTPQKGSQDQSSHRNTSVDGDQA
jgi:hypothetical protein